MCFDVFLIHNLLALRKIHWLSVQQSYIEHGNTEGHHPLTSHIKFPRQTQCILITIPSRTKVWKRRLFAKDSVIISLLFPGAASASRTSSSRCTLHCIAYGPRGCTFGAKWCGFGKQDEGFRVFVFTKFQNGGLGFLRFDLCLWGMIVRGESVLNQVSIASIWLTQPNCWVDAWQSGKVRCLLTLISQQKWWASTQLYRWWI